MVCFGHQARHLIFTSPVQGSKCGAAHKAVPSSDDERPGSPAARLKFSLISVNRLSHYQTGSYHQVGARRRAMDSGRRIPTTQLPRCVSAGSAETGNLEVFFPRNLSWSGARRRAYRQLRVCSSYLSLTAGAFLLPRENLCLQSVAMLCLSPKPALRGSLLPTEPRV